MPAPLSVPAAMPRFQPWAHARDEALRGLRGVLTDIDDTLTCEGAIEPAALAALHRLSEAGVPVIATTGRPAGWSEPCVTDWPVRAVVAENGGVLLQRTQGGGVLREFTVEPPERAARWQRLQACAAEILATVPGATLATDSPGRLTDIAVDHSEHAGLDAAGIAATLACMRRHGLTATVSSIHVNGWIGEHSKWSGAHWAVQRALGRGFDATEWLYVGDSTNDQLMFERVGASVGVANIARFVPQLAVLPAWVTAAERGRGFAEVAERLLAVRASPR
ncbi:haloacid dehalogenase [Sphaerotilus microaerophilus]|uniref:Haloacid dehalogenase n=2 Tax=Sphaerotilus microaerophilus TaxID=2914710 RepID=A0ABM7YHB6_9BURK|nr:haloacid dehalogenase [Sphaerotilus sp. FB-5]